MKDLHEFGYDHVAPLQSADNVQEQLSQLQPLVDDPRSPLISLLVDTEKYHLPIAENIEEQYPEDKDYLNPIDIDRVRHESVKLEDAGNFCEAITAKLMAVKRKIFEERVNLESEGLTNRG